MTVGHVSGISKMKQWKLFNVIVGPTAFACAFVFVTLQTHLTNERFLQQILKAVSNVMDFNLKHLSLDFSVLPQCWIIAFGEP